MLESRLNALVFENILQEKIHQIEMDIFINKKIYLYNNKLCNILYLFSNIIDYLNIVIKLNIINCILTYTKEVSYINKILIRYYINK